MRAFDAAADTLGLCFFAALVVRDNPAALVALTDMVKAMHGSSLTPTSMEELGKGILAVETDFNEGA
jgi:aldehyde:ferredoxin oxidoreductase